MLSPPVPLGADRSTIPWLVWWRRPVLSSRRMARTGLGRRKLDFVFFFKGGGLDALNHLPNQVSSALEISA